MKQIAFNILEKQLEMVDEVCNKLNSTRNSLLRDAIHFYLSFYYEDFIKKEYNQDTITKELVINNDK